MKQQLKDAGLIADVDAMRTIGEQVILGRGTETEKAARFLELCKKAGGAVELAMADYALRHVRDNLPARKRPVFGTTDGDRFMCGNRGVSETALSSRPIPNEPAVPAGSGVVVSIFDRVTIRGRSIGEIRMCDIDGIVATNAYETAVLRAIKTQFVPATPDATVRDCVSAAKLSKIIKDAEAKHRKTK